MKYLIFFDINGTLIERDKRTDLPYCKAIDECLGVTDGMNGVDTSARSDKDVFLEVIDNFNRCFSEELWDAFMTIYEKHLSSYNESDIWRDNVDSINFLSKLVKTDHKLSMITGELEIGARYKLEKIGVWKFFSTGGFGEDGLSRFDIADKAVEKAHEIVGNDYDNIMIIGDTVLDIQTARHLGAISVAITTGSHSREKLALEKPDYLIDTFSELENILL